MQTKAVIKRPHLMNLYVFLHRDYVLNLYFCVVGAILFLFTSLSFVCNEFTHNTCMRGVLRGRSQIHAVLVLSVTLCCILFANALESL